MRKLIPLLAALPVLTACGEVEIPFLAPVSISMPELEEAEDGTISYVQASELGTVDDLIAESPVDVSALEDFELTALKISDPEFDTVFDGDDSSISDPEFDTVFDGDDSSISDPEFDTYKLGDFATAVRVFISSDRELSDDDALIAVISDFPADQSDYDADITDAAVLSQYADGEFALVVEAYFHTAPPAEMDLPLILFGVATMAPLEMVTQ
ncbi:MAG TPA: hypothetical protein QGF58_21025 [Myxococcota bacterium]|nr:hypothetical protein [Myxococcota bacterium]